MMSDGIMGNRMMIVGLTGGIATGKSTTAEMIRGAGIPVHDADAAVHQLMVPGGGCHCPDHGDVWQRYGG